MLDVTSESKVTSFKQSVESVQTILTDIKKSHPELSLKIQAVQLECKKLLTDQQQAEEEHAICQEQFQAVHQQLAEAKTAADIQTLQKELVSFPEQLAAPKTLSSTSFQAKLEALQKSCQEQQIKLTGELRQGLDTKQKQLEKAKIEWQQSVIHQQKLNQAAQTQLKSELRQLEERLSKRLSELTQRVNHLETWAESAKHMLSELKDSDLKVKAQVQTLQTQLTQLLTEQQIYYNQQEEYQAELAELQTQLAKAPKQEAIKQLTDRLKAVEEQLIELSSQKLNAQPLHAKLEVLQTLQENKLKTLASTQCQEIEIQQKRLAQLKSLQTDLSQQVDKQNQHNQAELQALKREIRSLEERFKKELAGVKKEVKEIKTDMTRLEAKVDAQDPRYTVATKLLKLRTAILEDQFITNELKYYVAPNGEGLQSLGDHQPLFEWTQQHFLDVKAEPKVLLLQGVAGAGKSTFNRFLMRQLWQDEAWKHFKPGMPAPKAYLPIFIPLGSPQVQPTQLLKYLNDLPELVDDFTDQEINVLKTDYQLLLIADGYDEMSGNQKHNLYDTNQLQQYSGIKLVIGCRAQRAQELNETDVFTPHNTSGQPQHAYFKRRHVSPFNDAQIKDYISKYLSQNQHRSDIVLWENSQLYLDQLSKLPDLKALLTTPFALLMSIEVLPSIVLEAEKTAQEAREESKGDSKESKETKLSQTTQFTRAKLYDAFMDHWFKRQAEKARQAGDTTNAKILIQHYRQFCFKFAEGLRAAGITAVQYPFGEEVLFEEDLFADKPKEIVDPKGPRGPWVKKLFGTDNDAMVLTRKGAPLTVATGNYYQFIHASFIDYFSTTAMVAQFQPTEATKPEENKKEIQLLQDTASSSLEVLLGDKPMSREQFYLLADRLKQEPALQSQLLSIIERSKQSAQLALAAANAISSLNAAGVSLSGYDFRGIRIPGADLSGALLHGTQLQGADLTGVNLRGAWLMEAQLQGAHLKGIRFGEEALFQLKESVNACQYSPEGRWLAIASGNNIELYEAATRRWVRTFKGHTNDVRSISWDVKGERLASGGFDNTVRVWEVENGRELRCLQGHTFWVMSVTWDVKGERLVSGSYDFTVRVWEVESGRELHCFQVHKRGVNSVTWDVKSERLALGCGGRMLCVWDVSSGRELRYLGHTHEVMSVTWDVKGERLASGSRDKTVRVWDVGSGRELRCLQGHTDAVFSVAWDVKGMRLASGSEDKTVRVWDVESGRELHCFQGHESKVSSVTWDVKADRLASGSWDDTVRVWEAGSGRELRSLQGLDSVSSVTWDFKGERLASGSSDNTVRVWEAGSGRELRCLKVHTLGFVTSVTWDVKGERLASGSYDNMVRVWEVESGRELCCFKGHTRAVMSVAWDVKGERLASGSYDNMVRVWEVESGRELCCFKGHTREVMSVAWDVKGERLASGSYDNMVRVWEVESGRELCCFKGHTRAVMSVAWDVKGERLASGGNDNTVRVFEIGTGKELFRLLLPEAVGSVALAPSNEKGEALLAVAFGKAIGCFELISKDNTYTSRLKWLAVDGAQLRVFGLDITDTQDLSANHLALLQQRGAIGKPADTPSLETKESQTEARGDSKDESKPTGIKGFAASAAQHGAFASRAASPAKASTVAPVTEFKTTSRRG